jgi:uncharacterized SAM-binding protein YcdF (DUF218 family)
MRKRYLLVAAIQFLAGLVFYFLILGYRFTGALLMVLSVVTLVFGVLNTIKRTVFHIAFYAVLIGALVGSVVTGVFIGTHCGGSEDPEAEYVVVLGAGVNGSRPSASLHERMQAALAYAEEYPDAILILSGGQGDGEDLSEAQCMYDWLRSKGLSSKRLWMEDKATSTEENIRFSLDLIEGKTGERPEEIAVISSEYHLLRAELIAEEMGVEEARTYPASTENPIFFANMFLREIVAVWRQYLGI